MTISARRFTEVLRAHGHTVRIICTNNKADPELSCQKQYIPFFDKLVSAQGMVFAKPNKWVLKKGFQWADVIHFHVPFVLSHVGLKLARKMGKPYTSAFHVQPENITSSIHCSKIAPINKFIYWWFKKYFYKDCDHIHCPTEFIANELRKNGYKAKLYVISNGVDPDFTYRKLPAPPEFAEKYIILSVGRFSVEKRQDVLIRAVAFSKYASKIQLILAGQGPWKKYLERLGRRKLKHPPIMKFMSKEELLDVIAFSDLYVHCAESEIEGMSCIEAFSAGLVPVIADSPKSAASDFAMHPESLFPAGEYKELAKRIDYWIEHPEEKAEYEHKYSEHGREYNINNCVTKMEEMFQAAIDG